MDERYVVISADGHAGASMETYGDFLDPEFRDDFARFRATFQDPFEDLVDTESRDYRRSGGPKTNVLADFFIGAHASVLGVELVTRDTSRYRSYFPRLGLISPGT